MPLEKEKKGKKGEKGGKVGNFQSQTLRQHQDSSSSCDMAALYWIFLKKATPQWAKQSGHRMRELLRAPSSRYFVYLGTFQRAKRALCILDQSGRSMAANWLHCLLRRHS